MHRLYFGSLKHMMVRPPNNGQRSDHQTQNTGKVKTHSDKPMAEIRSHCTHYQRWIPLTGPVLDAVVHPAVILRKYSYPTNSHILSFLFTLAIAYHQIDRLP